jgi:hypothetical protein
LFSIVKNKAFVECAHTIVPAGDDVGIKVPDGFSGIIFDHAVGGELAVKEIFGLKGRGAVLIIDYRRGAATGESDNRQDRQPFL